MFAKSIGRRVKIRRSFFSVLSPLGILHSPAFLCVLCLLFQLGLRSLFYTFLSNSPHFTYLRIIHVIIKGSLSSSWMNSPIPSLLLHLWQNESVRTISMKIYATCTVIRMKIKWFSCENVLHKHLFYKWQFRRWESSLHNVQSSPSDQHSFQFLKQEVTSSISTPLPPPGWDASPLQGYPQTLILPVPIYTPEGILKHCESKVSRPRTQYNVPSQGLNPDCLW